MYLIKIEFNKINIKYQTTRMTSIVTSRFNNETWKENYTYRETNNIRGCIYCSPQQLSAKIHPNSSTFVVEMNNSTNKILGIGLITNKIQFDKYYKVYQIGNYNRYTYKGDHRIDRLDLEQLCPAVVNILDYILFKEKTHLKRGSGMTQIPQKLLHHKKCKDLDILKELRLIFYNYFTANIEFNIKPIV
jgi:hypothetical protein